MNEATDRYKVGFNALEAAIPEDEQREFLRKILRGRLALYSVAIDGTRFVYKRAPLVAYLRAKFPDVGGRAR